MFFEKDVLLKTFYIKETSFNKLMSKPQVSALDSAPNHTNATLPFVFMALCDIHPSSPTNKQVDGKCLLSCPRYLLDALGFVNFHMFLF